LAGLYKKKIPQPKPQKNPQSAEKSADCGFFLVNIVVSHADMRQPWDVEWGHALRVVMCDAPQRDHMWDDVPREVANDVP